MMKKRTLALLLCFTLLSLLFAGCAKQAAPAAEPAAEPAPAETAEPAPAEAAEPAPAQEAAPAAEPAPAETPAEPAPQEAPPAAEAETANPADLTIQDAMNYQGFVYDLPLADNNPHFDIYCMSAPPFMLEFLGADRSFNTAASTFFIEEQTGIDLEFIEIDMFSYSEKFALMIASGDYTDMLSGLGNYTAEEAFGDEVILDLTDYEETKMPVQRALVEMFGLTDDLYNENGQILCVNSISLGAQGAKGLTIRGDWLEEQGLEMPKTYDQLHDTAVALKEAYGLDHAMYLASNVNPSLALSAGYDLPGFELTSSGSHLFVVDKTLRSAYTDDNFKEYLKLLRGWFSEGLINPDFYSVTSDTGKDHFINSEFAFYWDNANFITENNNLPNLQGTGFHCVGGPYMMKTEDQVLHFGTGQALALGSGVYVTSECKDPDMLIKFLDWLFTEDGIKVSNYGVETDGPDSLDGTYFYDDAGEMQFTEYCVNNPNGLTFMNTVMPYCQDSLPSVKDAHKFDAYSLDADGLAATELWLHGVSTDNAWDFYGTTYMTDEETAAYNTAMNDVETAASEFILKAIVGDCDIDAEWDAYLARLDAMGLQTALGARQAALDRYYDRVGE